MIIRRQDVLPELRTTWNLALFNLLACYLNIIICIYRSTVTNEFVLVSLVAGIVSLAASIIFFTMIKRDTAEKVWGTLKTQHHREEDSFYPH